ncbi:enkurin domain-containing protein 1-like [Argiope bruennichi]|uniref:Enkurin domain-containing protein 1 n=1 Tax=Argiope bruennichi TaxID=94029 RepID=A0A8T0FYH5_ARGBR|nr:enkurin domain-containing protein 1-like [Argiope bruennichi]KAF8795792.1 Enkurin domain-containing protein 1 [Argiope bruennichi]
MECEVPRRPHTVGALPKVWTQSPLIMNLLDEIENEAKGPVSRPKSPQKNYMKENLKRLKEIQAQAKKKLAEKQPLRPLRVPNHYREVQSKILINPSQSNGKKADENLYTNPPKTAGFHRSQPPLSPCLRPKSERLSVPQQYRSLPDLNQSEDNDQNLEIVNKDMKTPRSDIISEKNSHSLTSSKRKPEMPHRLGQIPNYLTERKKQWELERERQLKLREEASIPKGYTLLPDEERIETLELLKKNQEEIIQSLAVLPVRNDTVRLRSYKEELERQLAKVEEGIKIFSRPKVLIKNDT